jgi:hypothetical protein
MQVALGEHFCRSLWQRQTERLFRGTANLQRFDEKDRSIGSSNVEQDD